MSDSSPSLEGEGQTLTSSSRPANCSHLAPPFTPELRVRASGVQAQLDYDSPAAGTAPYRMVGWQGAGLVIGHPPTLLSRSDAAVPAATEAAGGAPAPFNGVLMNAITSIIHQSLDELRSARYPGFSRNSLHASHPATRRVCAHRRHPTCYIACPQRRVPPGHHQPSGGDDSAVLHPAGEQAPPIIEDDDTGGAESHACACLAERVPGADVGAALGHRGAAAGEPAAQGGKPSPQDQLLNTQFTFYAH